MSRQDRNKRKAYVAMSGGVDSSVAAVLLKKRGFDVVGVFMKPWQPGLTTSDVVPVDNRHRKSVIHSDIRCQWQRDREDAMKVATQIGIPLLTWDFSKEYKKEVANYMLKEYRSGRTPNPDIMCNKHIKFGLFLKKALKEGASFIATGHYVRKAVRSNQQALLTARDKNKDQSYFLWTLTQEQLKYCLFPIGDHTKPEVRRMAKRFGLSTANKKDSQGVCFIGPLDMKEFLKNYIKPKRGSILDTAGNLVGYHDGIYYYTIGQRHGLNIGDGKGPYYVAGKDIGKNIIYVSPKNDLNSNSLKTENLNWISKVNLPSVLDVRMRYRAKLSKAVVKNNGEVNFKKPETAITPGQSAVFYRGDKLLGGGIIK